MAQSDDPYKEGYLWFPPQGVLSQLKSWQKRYCRLFKSSKHGIDRLEVSDGIEEQKLSTIASILPLESCVKITQDAQKNQSHVFAVWTKTGVHHFSANSEHEMTDWICALQTVAFKDNISKQTIEEDNDLYCPSGDTGIFSVRLISSDASERCGLKEQNYTLAITSVALELRESGENDALLFTWPYPFIRKYGQHKTGRFTFEAGRKCSSGEGEFYLEHSNQLEIFRCISSKMKNMKKLLNGEGGSSIIFGDIQFPPGMNMVAGSRSPLPPSPVNPLDGELISFPYLTKPLLPLCPIGLPTTEINPIPPRLKPKPKTIFTKKLPTPFNEHKKLETPDDAYEDIQERDNAWRYMGQTDSSDSFYSNKSVVSSDGSENYDHLKHFGFIPETAPGYKKIYPIASGVKHDKSPNIKPYIKSETTILPARKADDSHYGYGTINKISSSGANRSNKESVNSVVHNELQYALVCKPNKV